MKRHILVTAPLRIAALMLACSIGAACGMEVGDEGDEIDPEMLEDIYISNDWCSATPLRPYYWAAQDDVSAVAVAECDPGRRVTVTIKLQWARCGTTSWQTVRSHTYQPANRGTFATQPYPFQRGKYRSVVVAFSQSQPSSVRSNCD